jgi:hypothetical protein
MGLPRTDPELMIRMLIIGTATEFVLNGNSAKKSI